MTEYGNRRNFNGLCVYMQIRLLLNKYIGVSLSPLMQIRSVLNGYSFKKGNVGVSLCL